MKKLLTTLLSAATLLASVSSEAADKITIATEGAWAPFNYVDASGTIKGFDVDIANALCAEMKVECNIVINDWDGMIPSLKNRKFDAIVSSMSITKDRLKQVDFTDKYYSGGLRFVAMKGKEFTNDPSALKGKTIGAQRSTIASQYLEDELAGVVDIKLYDSQEKVYLDAQSGRLDGFLSDELPTHAWLQSEKAQQFTFTGEAFAKDDIIGIAVRKNDKLKDQINKALATIIANGTYAEINKAYFPFTIY